jgi:predicted enzyme related to lactoylglutathione lyase
MPKEIGHIELVSKDLTATKKFYSKLFGWKFEMIGDGYAMFKTTQKGVGGGFMLGKKIKPGSTTLYVNVDTIPATQQKAKSLGGRILKKRKSIGGGMGYWGTIGDPHGNVIGLWSKK